MRNLSLVRLVLSVLLSLFSLVVTIDTYAQTVLSPGDLVVTSINSDSTFSTAGCPNPASTNNAFEFVNLIDISTGTVIYFTDNAWSGDVWRTTEGTIIFTATSAIPAGTKNYYNDCQIVDNPSQWSKDGSRDPGVSGDELLVYQGSLNDTNPNFIYGIGWAILNPWISSGAPTSSTSYIPSALSLGTTASSIGTLDNYQYVGLNCNYSLPTFLSDMANPINRTGSDTLGFGSTLCTYVSGDTTAPVVILSGNSTMTLAHGGTYHEDGAEWTDNIDGSGFIAIASSGVVDTDTLGTYLLEYRYVDGAGNTGNTVTRTVMVTDQTAPVVSLSGSSSITLAQGGSYSEDGAEWADNIDGSGFITIASSGVVDTNTLGTYLLEYRYVDGAGNTGNTVTRTVMVTDQTAPVVSTGSASINEGTVVLVNFSALATDSNPITSYGVDIDNDGTVDISTTLGLLTLTWSQLQSFGITGNNATLLASDVYYLGLQATDNGGNIGTGVFELKVYNISPVVGISYPIVSGAIYSGFLPIQWLITEPADQDIPMNVDIFYSTNGVTYLPLANVLSNRSDSLTRDTTTVSDGINYRLRVRAIDDFGNHTVTSLPFLIDNTGPVVNGQTSYTISEGNSVHMNLTGTSDMIAGIDRFVWTVGSIVTGTVSGLLDFSRSQLQSAGIVNDGVYPITVEAFDSIGNSTIATLTLTITNTSPIVFVSQPGVGIYSGDVVIEWNAIDPANGDLPLSITLEYSNSIYSGTIIQGTSLSNPYHRDVSSIPDGTGYMVRVTATDDDNSHSMSSSSFSIDHTAPTIVGFLSPYTIDEGTGLTIDLSHSIDTIAGLSGGYFSGTINGISLPIVTSGYWNLSRLDLSGYGITNGYGQSYEISVQVVDAIGNVRLITGGLIINNIPPILDTHTPIVGSTLLGVVPVTWSVSDVVDSPLSLVIEYGQTTNLNGPWNFLTSGNSTVLTGLSWDTIPVADGIYYIRISATDDNSTVYDITGPLTINNIPDYVGGGGGSSVTIVKDNCSQGDYSLSYYDGTCGIAPIEEDIQDDVADVDTVNEQGTSNSCPIQDYTLETFTSLSSSEKQQFVVCRLYANHQTIFDTVPKFDYDRIVTREEASRMITNFVKTVIKKDAVRSIEDPLCQFTDLAIANSGLIPYIKESCAYGIFNGTMEHKFLPKDTLNQAHAVAIVLRSSYGYNDETVTPWFQSYIHDLVERDLTWTSRRKTYNISRLTQRGMTRGSLGELMYRVAIDVLGK